MKVTVDSKKGLKTNLKVFVDRKTIDEKIGVRLTELSKTANIKGFRPGKVPVEVLKKQFGKAVYGEVLEKILKETYQYLKNVKSIIFIYQQRNKYIHLAVIKILKLVPLVRNYAESLDLVTLKQ